MTASFAQSVRLSPKVLVVAFSFLIWCFVNFQKIDSVLGPLAISPMNLRISSRHSSPMHLRISSRHSSPKNAKLSRFIQSLFSITKFKKFDCGKLWPCAATSGGVSSLSPPDIISFPALTCVSELSRCVTKHVKLQIWG